MKQLHITDFCSVKAVPTLKALIKIHTFCKAHNWPRPEIAYLDVSKYRQSRKYIYIRNVYCTDELLRQLLYINAHSKRNRYLIGGTLFFAEGITEVNNANRN